MDADEFFFKIKFAKIHFIYSQKYRASAHFDFHPLDLILNFPISRLPAEFFQIRVLGEPLEIAIAEFQRLFQR